MAKQWIFKKILRTYPNAKVVDVLYVTGSFDGDPYKDAMMVERFDMGIKIPFVIDEAF